MKIKKWADENGRLRVETLPETPLEALNDHCRDLQVLLLISGIINLFVVVLLLIKVLS